MVKADLLFSAGRILTFDPDLPRAEAVAVRGGRVLAVGSAADLEGLRGPDTVHFDLSGALALPGLSDNHTHFFEGSLRYDVDLRDAADREAFRRRVLEAVAESEPGQWIVGGYWNEELWGGRLPDRGWLDDITPDNPALLLRMDIHSALCNSAALEAAGVSESSQDPAGGVFSRDAEGRLTGLLIEAAVDQVKAAAPEPTGGQARKALLRSMRRANSLGITHVCDMVPGPEQLGLYLDLESRGELTCRIDVYAPLAFWERFARAAVRSGVGRGLVRLAGMKAFMDGSLGSRTALMMREYEDDPGNSGMAHAMAQSLSDLEAAITCADAAGFAVALHAIGDRANKLALDIFERVRRRSPYPHLLHRIEHAQHLLEADVPRFAELGVTAACQPAHLIDDGCFAGRRLGAERSRRSYQFRSLLRSGARLTFGSDWPVVDNNPLLGLWAAVTRRTADAAFPDGWIAEEKLSVEEAIAAYTSAAAEALGQSGQWGKISPGAWADMVVLDRDIMKCDVDEIREARARLTFLGGRQVYGEEQT